MENTEKNLVQYLAEKDESNRRLNIIKIQNTLNDENTRRRNWGIATGVFFVGLLASIHFSGIDPMQAVETELKALNSFESLKDYLKTLTPAMIASSIGTAISYRNYIRHNKKYREANREFYAIDAVEEIEKKGR